MGQEQRSRLEGNDAPSQKRVAAKKKAFSGTRRLFASARLHLNTLMSHFVAPNTFVTGLQTCG